MELVQELQTSAADVTRQLPEAHVITRRYREPLFREAVEHFIALLYQMDVDRLTESQLEGAQHWTLVVQKAVELHMLLRYTDQDASECATFTELVQRLRDSLEALEAGFPADPKKRPTDEQMLERFSSGLRRAKLA